METTTEPLELDLAQVNWPFCLLELKDVLQHMNKGQLLEVKVSDPTVLSTMEQVLSSSLDQVIRSGEQGQLYMLTVKKG